MSAGDGPFRVFFTDPASPNADSLRGGPDEALVDAVLGARLTIDLAAYDLDLWGLRDALLDAHQRGVNVRIVAESDNIDEPEMQELIEAGIPVLGDRREGLMHNKFAVIDRHQVWTGSMNYTVRGAYRNNNNLISIESSRLAEDYLAEFDEMFVDDQFGPGSPSNTPFQMLEVDGRQLEVFFSPDDGAAARLEDLLRGAQESIYFLAFSFTSDPLSQAILDRSRAGVAVSGVFEESQASGQGAEYGSMRSAGLDVHLDGNPANMHHKVIIIDRQIIVTGSYNFSASAERRNDENMLIIYDPQLAAAFLEEFDRVYQLAQP
jgi:phosphatidylserine/phosphatidylglycerophosphate/cardiolipin synthase-like enzyme